MRQTLLAGIAILLGIATVQSALAQATGTPAPPASNAAPGTGSTTPPAASPPPAAGPASPAIPSGPTGMPRSGCDRSSAPSTS